MNTAILLSANSTGAADFSNDTWWITLIKAVFIVFWLIISVIMALWVERRGLGRIQTRPGPNVHGPLGLFQALACLLYTSNYVWKLPVRNLTLGFPRW